MPSATKPAYPTFRVSEEIVLANDQQLDFQAFKRKIEDIEAAKYPGCYVFFETGYQGKPLYVGMTTKPLLDRLKQHELLIRKLRERVKRPIGLYLLTPERRQGKVNVAAIGALEIELIGLAMRRNPELLNIKNTLEKTVVIKGVLNSSQGKPTMSESSFKKVVGIRS